MKYLNTLPLVAVVSAQEANEEVPAVLDNGFRTINGNLYTQTGLYLRSYVPQLLSQFLDDDDKVDALLSHGCFCARLDNTNPNFPNLGGQDPLDELDEVCRGWLRSRNCNDNLIGGSCQADRESMRSGAYTMDIVTGNLQISNCGFTNTDCESDTCVIDLMYLKQVSAFLEANPSWAANPVTGPGICSPAHLENVRGNVWERLQMSILKGCHIWSNYPVGCTGSRTGMLTTPGPTLKAGASSTTTGSTSSCASGTRW